MKSSSPRIKISVVTVFPELISEWAKTSLIDRACKQGVLAFDVLRLADFVAPKERIDTPACGPGAGMVLKAPVVSAAIEEAFERSGKGPVIFFTPSGTMLSQPLLETIAHDIVHERAPQALRYESSYQHIVLVCGRYEGVDSRVHEQYAALEVSVGPFVVMGGDVPAQLFLEGLLRLIPGVVGDAGSVENDSFSGALVDYPAYGHPVEWRGKQVPAVLLSGDHAKITAWRRQTALHATLLQHFNWLRRAALDQKDRLEVSAAMPPHYIVLMHDQVLIGKHDPQPGVTSVTTIDVHDIARTAATYGIKKFFIVTSLDDQHELLRVFFEFWHTAAGKMYNENRYDAMSRVRVVRSIEDAEREIAADNAESMPVRVATSAKPIAGVPSVTYDDQGVVWNEQRPVLIVFGTGQGLTQELLESCHFGLTPVFGFSDYNHLSVRCAVAIVLDRWCGHHAPAFASGS